VDLCKGDMWSLPVMFGITINTSLA